MKYSKYPTILLLLFFFKFALSSAQDTTKVSLSKYKEINIELSGKIKQVKINTEDAQNKRSESITYNFDKKGMPVEIVRTGLRVDIIQKSLVSEEIHYVFKSGKLISKLDKLIGLDGTVNEYDKNWNLTLEKEYFQDILIKETASKYDTKNRLIEQTEYLYGAFSNYNEFTQERKDDFLYEKNWFSYDGNGNLILNKVQNFINQFTESKIYKYDHNNNCIEEGQCFIAKRKDTCSYRPLYGFEYNSKNLKVKEFQLTQFSPHNTDSYYKYDERGNETEAIGYYVYPEKRIELGYHYVYEYNEFNKKTKETESVGKYRSIDFEKYKTEIITYDKYSNLTLQQFLTESGAQIKVISKEYKYDKVGNWIRCETKEGKNYADLKTTEICSRELTYYN